jgi:hypothetical protein
MQPKPFPKEIASKLETARKSQKIVQEENEQEYQEALITTKQKIMESEGPEIKERMQDQIRQWFITHKEVTGKFPVYPENSSKVAQELTNLANPQDNNKRTISSPARSPRTPKTPANRSGTAPKSTVASKEVQEEVEVTLLPRSKFTAVIEAGISQFEKVWKNRDESMFYGQKYDTELVKQSLFPVVETEIRKIVDEQLRKELEKLKLTIEGAKKDGKKDKSRPGSERKRKSKKDPTGDRTIESMFADLVNYGVLKKSPSRKLSEYMSEYSFEPHALSQVPPKSPRKDRPKSPSKKDKNEETQPLREIPSMSEVRNVVVESCILPVGSEFVHRNLPNLVKSVLLYGLPGTGKTMLSEAVINESGSLYFDLSPANLMASLPSLPSSSSEIGLMMHMIFKVAKAMAPAVVYIDEMELLYGRKKKKKNKKGKSPSPFEKPEIKLPKPLTKNVKKFLVKETKLLKPGERVIIIGNSRDPTIGGKTFLPFFNKVFYVPLPHYGARYKLWKHKIMEKGGEKAVEDLDLTTLARITEGYTGEVVI